MYHISALSTSVPSRSNSMPCAVERRVRSGAGSEVTVAAGVVLACAAASSGLVICSAAVAAAYSTLAGAAGS